MRKVLSFTLILLLAVSLVIPFDPAFAGTREQDVFNKVTSSILWTRFNDISLTDKIDFGMLLLTLDDNDIVMNDIIAALDEGTGALKARWQNKGINSTGLRAAADVISGIRDEYDIVDIIIPVLDDQLTLGTLISKTDGSEVTFETFLGEVSDSMKVALSETNTILNSELIDPSDKLDLALDIINLVLNPNYVKVMELSNGSLDVVPQTNSLVSKLENDILPVYFSSVSTFTANEKADINLIFSKLEGRLNDGTLTASELNTITAGLSAFSLYEEYVAPPDGDGPGDPEGPGGGGTGGTAIVDEPTIEETLEQVEEALDLVENQSVSDALKTTTALIESVQGSLEEEAVQSKVFDVINLVMSKAGSLDESKVNIESTDDGVNVSVSPTDIARAAAELLSAANTIVAKLESSSDLVGMITKEVVINVPSSTNENTVVHVELPTNTLKDLSDKGVGVAVQAKGVTFRLPTELIELSGEKLSLQISNKDVGKDKEAEVKAKAEEVKDGKLSPVGKLYDLDMNIKDKENNTTTKLESFNKKPRLEIPLDTLASGVDVNKLGIYVYDEKSGSWEYIKSKLDKKRNVLVFEAPHFSIYTVMEYNKEFKDTLGHWAEEDIEIMAAKHITKGVTSDSYAPDGTITRAQFAALVVRALGLEGNGSTTFTDVSQDAWYAKEVSLAADAGIVNGMGGGSFAPDQNITREQMAVMIARAYEDLVGKDLEGDSISFNDKDGISTWAVDAVKGAVNKSIITGFNDNSFRPKDNATRAQGIVMLKRLLDQ